MLRGMPTPDESTFPILPCRSVDEITDFYRMLGFDVTYRQTHPNPYAGPEGGDERGPAVRGERQFRAVRVLGVADGDATARSAAGPLHALVAVAGTAAGPAPGDAGQTGTTSTMSSTPVRSSALRV